jgi:AcrR family transcriptional regulator
LRVRTEGKRNCILEVAAQVFMEFGYARASMAEIAARVGGSKATLYGYFPSKEQLFVEVVNYTVVGDLAPAFQDLASVIDEDPRDVLTRFGERILVSVVSPKALAARRMVIAEAMQSDIGKRFWVIGPQKNLNTIATYLANATKAGRLHVRDCHVATLHLISLYEAELAYRWLYGIQTIFTRKQIRAAVQHAVGVFLSAYGPKAEVIEKGLRRTHIKMAPASIG